MCRVAWRPAVRNQSTSTSYCFASGESAARPAARGVGCGGLRQVAPACCAVRASVQERAPATGGDNCQPLGRGLDRPENQCNRTRGPPYRSPYPQTPLYLLNPTSSSPTHIVVSMWTPPRLRHVHNHHLYHFTHPPRYLLLGQIPSFLPSSLRGVVIVWWVNILAMSGHATGLGRLCQIFPLLNCKGDKIIRKSRWQRFTC